MSLSNAPRKGDQTRAAILAAAAVAFGDRGYDSATLEDVAGGLGLTRGAVLHHFGSKEEILREVIGPFLADVDALLDGIDVAKPMSAHRRRRFLTGFVDLLCDNRSVSSLLTRDITLQGHLDPTMRLADRAERFSRLLAGPEPTDIDVLRTLIAIGGMVRPLAAPPQVLSLNTPEQRRVMVDCAIASLRS